MKITGCFAMRAVWGLCATLSFACSSSAPASDASSAGNGAAGNAGSAAGGTASSAGTSGSNAAAGGNSGSPSAGSVPDGFQLAPGVELKDSPKCDEFSNTSCNGNCVTAAAASNGCQAVATARIFSELARDAGGTYLSLQGSGTSEIVQLDPETGTLISLAKPPGDNQHLRLSLSSQVIYFVQDRQLFSMPRAGGEGTLLPPELPFITQFEVVDDRRFFGKVSLDPEVDEIDIVQGTKTAHGRDATSLIRDGSDLYFAEAGTLNQAPGADFDAAAMLAPGPVETLLGISGDWIYAVGGAAAERAIRRFPKAGGAGERLRTLGDKEMASLADDALLFTRRDGARLYVCASGLDGKSPTIYGFLETSEIGFLTADRNFVYAVNGFNMVRFKR